MSLVGDNLAVALSTINTSAGIPVIEYRPGTTGTWTVIEGCHFHRDEAIKEYSDQRLAEAVDERSTLLVPESGPALVIEYQVRVNSDDNDIWAVMEGPTGVGQSRYGLMRRDPSLGQPDRGRLNQ